MRVATGMKINNSEDSTPANFKFLTQQYPTRTYQWRRSIETSDKTLTHQPAGKYFPTSKVTKKISVAKERVPDPVVPNLLWIMNW
jgi:hypothetical protein